MSRFHSYTPTDGHGLPHDPFKSVIAPRPIGWISTVTKAGTYNLAPYSYFNAFAVSPPIIGFCSDRWKDSVQNCEDTGCFVHNAVSADLADKMNVTSAPIPADESEFEKAGLTAIDSDVIDAPRLAEALVSMECKLIEIKKIQDLGGRATGNYLVFGEVVRMHINTDILRDGIVDELALGLVGRLGHHNYLKAENLFAMRRPAE